MLSLNTGWLESCRGKVRNEGACNSCALQAFGSAQREVMWVEPELCCDAAVLKMQMCPFPDRAERRAASGLPGLLATHRVSQGPD